MEKDLGCDHCFDDACCNSRRLRQSNDTDKKDTTSDTTRETTEQTETSESAPEATREF
mgnify:CR=1 FL=1